MKIEINKKKILSLTAILILVFLVSNSFNKKDNRFLRYITDTISLASKFSEQETDRIYINKSKNIKVDEIIKNAEKQEEIIFVPTVNNISELTTFEDFKKHLYTIDESAYVMEEDLKVQEFANRNLKLPLNSSEPKVLIFHTHSQEDFIDSREGKVEDTIVGVGERLAEILVYDYNISVVHDVGAYDFEDGKIERGQSYEKMEVAVKKILEKYPSIEVTIDLHRDGVPETVHLVTSIDDKPTAQIMFFNGITRENKNGKPKELPSLVNPYLNENLSLSMQMFLKTNELYEGLARKIYIRAYRYSLHLKPRSMLVEVGANTSTVEEAKNAMAPLAKILVEVLRE